MTLFEEHLVGVPCRNAIGRQGVGGIVKFVADRNRFVKLVEQEG